MKQRQRFHAEENNRANAELAQENFRLAKENDELRRQVEQLQRGEFICQRCHLRKDAEFEKGDF